MDTPNTQPCTCCERTMWKDLNPDDGSRLALGVIDSTNTPTGIYLPITAHMCIGCGNIVLTGNTT